MDYVVVQCHGCLGEGWQVDIVGGEIVRIDCGDCMAEGRVIVAP